MRSLLHVGLRAGLCALAIGGSLSAIAQELPTPPDLPSTAQAIVSIDNDPAVVEARNALAAAGHGAAALAAGSHEWVAKAGTQRRNYRSGGTSNEWSAQLERGIRINGKAELDRRIGDIEIDIAQARVGEARHEAARTLADLWLDWLAAGQARELLLAQLSFAEATLRAVETRKRAGDASALDVNIVRTDLVDVQRQASLAATNQAKARAKLRVRFPDLPLDARALLDPADLPLTEAQWHDRILEEADPLKVAEGQLFKAELNAARSKADRVPDPTVSVYAANEAFRNERVYGFNISIPLSGTYRSERMRQSLQEAEVARAAVARERRDLELEIAEGYANAIGSTERWRIADEGARTASDSARLMQRAYTLGEADLQSLLLARRQSLDASRSVLEARVEALRSNYRLLVDAHLIWDLAHE